MSPNGHARLAGRTGDAARLHTRTQFGSSGLSSDRASRRANNSRLRSGDGEKLLRQTSQVQPFRPSSGHPTETKRRGSAVIVASCGVADGEGRQRTAGDGEMAQFALTSAAPTG